MYADRRTLVILISWTTICSSSREVAQGNKFSILLILKFIRKERDLLVCSVLVF